MGEEIGPVKDSPGTHNQRIQIKNRGCLAAAPAMGEVGRQAIGNNLAFFIEEKNDGCQEGSKIFFKILIFWLELE